MDSNETVSKVMEKTEFKVTINAPLEKVWYSLWDQDNYNAWTSVFCEGSHAISDWEEGSKVHFLSPGGEGMSSLIEECKLFKVMSFKHITGLKNFEEQPIDEKTKEWSGCIERYELSESNGQTSVLVIIDISEPHIAYFKETFPKGLQIVKDIAENPVVSSITVRTSTQESLEKVWDYWTSPEHIVNWNFASDDWYCPKATNDLKVNGSFNYTMAAKDDTMSFDFEGKYTEIENHKKIVYNIIDGRKVTISFNVLDGKTIITQTFEPENENTVDLQRSGWQAIMTNFKKYIEN